MVHDFGFEKFMFNLKLLKMKNLENYGIQEMDAKEIREVDGGTGTSWFWQAAVATFVYNVFADWDDNVAAFHEGRGDLLGSGGGASGSW
jgi:hypothetical protein